MRITYHTQMATAKFHAAWDAHGTESPVTDRALRLSAAIIRAAQSPDYLDDASEYQTLCRAVQAS